MIWRFHRWLDDNEMVKLAFLLCGIVAPATILTSTWHPVAMTASGLWIAFWAFTRVRYLSKG